MYMFSYVTFVVLISRIRMFSYITIIFTCAVITVRMISYIRFLHVCCLNYKHITRHILYAAHSKFSNNCYSLRLGMVPSTQRRASNIAQIDNTLTERESYMDQHSMEANLSEKMQVIETLLPYQISLVKFNLMIGAHCIAWSTWWKTC